MASTSAGSKTITGYLKRVIGSPVGEIIPLTNKDISIGRTKDSDIRVKDPNISRNHCSLHYSSDEWFITDLGGINGTFLDNIKLIPRDPIALKDGMGIYLGPPSDSPVAFVFIKNKEKEVTPQLVKTFQSIKDPSEKETEIPIVTSNTKKRTHTGSAATNTSKRHAPSATTSQHQPSSNMRPVPSASTSQHQLSSSNKRHAPSTSSLQHQPSSNMRHASPESILQPQPVNSFKRHAPSTSTSQHQLSMSEDDGDSDVSISSLDSLRTRIRKMNSQKKKKKRPPAARKERNICPLPFELPIFGASTSSAANADYVPKSAACRKLDTLKETTPGVIQELDTIFNDTDSLNENGNEKCDSESLINDAGPSELHRTTEELIKEDNTKDTSNKESSEKLGEMLEEELICNICTEVFIKATTLGCSHTFCEHCITQWKKKQKRCPMCRELITAETRVLIMDNFIEKAVQKLDKTYQDKRKEVIAFRDAEKANTKEKKSKRKKGSRHRSSRGAQPTVISIVTHIL